MVVMSTISSAVPAAGVDFGRADALDDAIAGHALAREEAPGQIHVFGGDAQAPAMHARELRGDVFEVGHACDIDPAIGHRHHHVGAAEAERLQELDRAVDIGQRLADQIFAGHAELHAAGLELVHDLGRRGVDHLDAVETVERAAIAPLMARAAQRQAGALEQGGGLVLQSALGGHGDRELGGHHRSSPRGGEQALGVDGRADGRHLSRRAEMDEQTVIAAAAGDGLVDALGFDLEHQPRVIFEVAAELGGEDSRA